MSTKRIGIAVLAAAALVACNESTGLVGTGQTVSLSFSGRAPGAAVMTGASILDAAGDSMVISGGGNTLVIKTVEIVLRKIDLKRAKVTGDCDSIAHEDNCGEFKAGDLLLSVPLAAGVVTSFAVAIDSGAYKSVEFKIHKPSGDAMDVALMAANPTWPANTSIRVTGTYNGTAFTYTTSLDVKQETTFNPPMVVNASGTATNLTLRLDVASWFIGTGGAILNPATANSGQPNEGTVQSTIKASFKAFRDDDKDGNESNG